MLLTEQDEIEDFGGLESEGAMIFFNDVIDKLTTGLQSAEASQDDIMKAQINARLGYIFYKCVHKGKDRVKMLKKAKSFYSAMKQAMGTMQSYGDDDYQVIEKWFVRARQEDMELRAEITELDVPSKNDKERKAHE